MPPLEPYGPLPELPELTEEDEEAIADGERVEKVTMPRGVTGSGISVQDVALEPDAVWERVSAFRDYESLIKTVRNVDIYHEDGSNIKALIEVSRFKLQLYVNFTVYDDTRTVAWTLDSSRTTRFIRECVGCWYVQPLEPGRSRVWFIVRVRLASFVPRIIESLVARVGLRRATKWIAGLPDLKATSAAQLEEQAWS